MLFLILFYFFLWKKIASKSRRVQRCLQIPVSVSLVNKPSESYFRSFVSHPRLQAKHHQITASAVHSVMDRKHRLHLLYFLAAISNFCMPSSWHVRKASFQVISMLNRIGFEGNCWEKSAGKRKKARHRRCCSLCIVISSRCCFLSSFFFDSTPSIHSCNHLRLKAH